MRGASVARSGRFLALSASGLWSVISFRLGEHDVRHLCNTPGCSGLWTSGTFAIRRDVVDCGR